ncbi:SLATT domain-containing protein, partial [Cellulosimicrobium funkei]|uniref:SLATT domain-containing protein n=1 Tax=Cellulosimicrobium funkei TaxID=264251 RepID=UPI0036F6B248
GLLIVVGQLAYPDGPFDITISTVLIMASIVGMTITPFLNDREKYNENGIKMTGYFNKLRQLYLKVKSSSATDFESEEREMETIMNQFYSINSSNQIFASDWYAHYKFFRQLQIDWINEQKNFKLLRDKIPTSFIVFLIAIILVIPAWIYIFKGELPFVS